MAKKLWVVTGCENRMQQCCWGNIVPRLPTILNKIVQPELARNQVKQCRTILLTTLNNVAPTTLLHPVFNSFWFWPCTQAKIAQLFRAVENIIEQCLAANIVRCCQPDANKYQTTPPYSGSILESGTSFCDTRLFINWTKIYHSLRWKDVHYLQLQIRLHFYGNDLKKV